MRQLVLSLLQCYRDPRCPRHPLRRDRQMSIRDRTHTAPGQSVVSARPRRWCPLRQHNRHNTPGAAHAAISRKRAAQQDSPERSSSSDSHCSTRLYSGCASIADLVLGRLFSPAHGEAQQNTPPLPRFRPSGVPGIEHRTTGDRRTAQALSNRRTATSQRAQQLHVRPAELFQAYYGTRSAGSVRHRQR